MPRTLKEKDIVWDKVRRLVRMSSNETWLATNPVQLMGEE